MRDLLTRLRRLVDKKARCPDETQLAAYADARLSSNDRARFEAHAAACPKCLDQLAFLAERADTPHEPVPEWLMARARAAGGSAARRPARLFPAWAPAAAAACLIVVLGVWVSERPSVPRISPATQTVPHPESSTPPAGSPALDSSRSHEAIPQQRPNVRNLPGTGSALLGEPRVSITGGLVRFEWNALAGCLYYQVRVLSVAGDVVWEKPNVEGTRTEILLGPEIQAGKEYFVIVRAYLPDGKTVPSNAARFQVKP